jgi:hypothetical protein
MPETCRMGILVLTGITAREKADRFPYRASRIVDSVADLIDEWNEGLDRETFGDLRASLSSDACPTR